MRLSACTCPSRRPASSCDTQSVKRTAAYPGMPRPSTKFDFGIAVCVTLPLRGIMAIGFSCAADGSAFLRRGPCLEPNSDSTRCRACFVAYRFDIPCAITAPYVETRRRGREGRQGGKRRAEAAVSPDRPGLFRLGVGGSDAELMAHNRRRAVEGVRRDARMKKVGSCVAR